MYDHLLNLNASKASSVWAGEMEPVLGVEEGEEKVKLRFLVTPCLKKRRSGKHITK